MAATSKPRSKSSTTGRAAGVRRTTTKTTSRAKSTSPRARSKTTSAKAPPKSVAAKKTPAQTTAQAKAQATGQTAAPKTASDTAPELRVTAQQLSKKTLLERVDAATEGVKRRDAKATMEATLNALGAALAAGEELNLPGFGKLRINRVQEHANGHVYHCRIRQPKPSAVPTQPLAAQVEDS